MEFVLILPGEFMMGCGEDVDEVVRVWRVSERTVRLELPQHKVRITRPFYMSKYEVTNAQFRVRSPEFPRVSTQGLNFGGDAQPIVRINWGIGMLFCRWLSARSGIAMRMPTEAEWEYACRAGTNGPFYWGSDPTRGVRFANVADQDDGHKGTAPVGRLQPNPWGLYDMLGNVFEFCSDTYDPAYYSNSPEADPKGPEPGEQRILRGGCWQYPLFRARTTFRRHQSARTYGLHHGIRCVAEIPNQ